MSRALGIVAEAVAAVIAAELQTQLNITRSEARGLGRSAVAALVGDGWHITAGPAGFPHPSPREDDAPPSGEQP